MTGRVEELRIEQRGAMHRWLQTRQLLLGATGDEGVLQQGAEQARNDLDGVGRLATDLAPWDTGRGQRIDDALLERRDVERLRRPFGIGILQRAQPLDDLHGLVACPCTLACRGHRVELATQCKLGLSGRIRALRERRCVARRTHRPAAGRDGGATRRRGTAGRGRRRVRGRGLHGTDRRDLPVARRRRDHAGGQAGRRRSHTGRR